MSPLTLQCVPLPCFRFGDPTDGDSDAVVAPIGVLAALTTLGCDEEAVHLLLALLPSALAAIRTHAPGNQELAAQGVMLVHNLTHHRYGEVASTLTSTLREAAAVEVLQRVADVPMSPAVQAWRQAALGALSRSGEAEPLHSSPFSTMTQAQ